MSLGIERMVIWLWDSTNMLRDSIDSSDFKNYIFGLLFIKRYNDLFEEEVANIIAKKGISKADTEDETFFQLSLEARKF